MKWTDGKLATHSKPTEGSKAKETKVVREVVDGQLIMVHFVYCLLTLDPVSGPGHMEGRETDHRGKTGGGVQRQGHSGRERGGGWGANHGTYLTNQPNN